MADVEERSDEVLLRAAATADVLRAAGLRGLEEATRARQLSLQREHGRLSAAFGADHPRTLAVADQIRYGAVRLRHVSEEAVRAETPTPRPQQGEWVLYGYVRNSDLEPVPDLTVSLVDARGRLVEALGTACTDAKGYFRIVAAVARAEAPGEGTIGEPAARKSVCIWLTDPSGKQVYRGEEQIRPAADQIDYREIVLGQQGPGCGPPTKPTEADQGAPKKSPRRGKPKGREGSL